MNGKWLIAIGGPTASGKTELAISLARHYKTEILNADSRQVYAEMNIGVGKPSGAQLGSVPHHLVGHHSIHASYSAAQFAEEALEVLDIIFAEKNIAIVTGGTGLYLKALLEGMDEIPDIDASFAKKWEELMISNGIDFLQEALLRHDPVYAAEADLHNARRLIRALSVTEATGQPYSSYRTGLKIQRHFCSIPIALSLPREVLYQRINQRVVNMMAAGWWEEAETLYPHRHLKSLQTVGYPEIFEAIENEISVQDILPSICQSTRRYAKRQLTWFRNQGEWMEFDPNEEERIITHIDSILNADPLSTNTP